MASKYGSLADYLRRQGGPRHTMSLAEIEHLPFDELALRQCDPYLDVVRSPCFFSRHRLPPAGDTRRKESAREAPHTVWRLSPGRRLGTLGDADGVIRR
jgi:hypothetical protein